MCLVVNLERTEACREALRYAGGTRIVYKFLCLGGAGPELLSPILSRWVWKPGWHEAEGAIPSKIFTGMRIRHGGFHGYFDPPLNTPAEFTHFQVTAVPFWAFERDFLCAGDGDPTHVLFRRLYLDPGDYELSRIRILQKLRRKKAYRARARSDSPGFRFPSINLTPKQLDDVIRRCSERLSRLPSTRPRPEPPFDLDVVYDGVRRRIETGMVERALVDLTPSASEPTDAPIVWIHQAKRPLPTRSVRRIGRPIPLRTILGVPVIEPSPLPAA